MTVALAIAPIILTILCGYAVMRTRMLDATHWDGIELLSFRLLIPIVLIKSIALSDLDLGRFGNMIAMVMLALVLTAAAVVAYRALRKSTPLPNPDFTTLFQTTTRWNAFISLAAAALLAGPQALTLIAAAMAVLIPLIDVCNIVVLARRGTAQASARGIAIAVAKKPLVPAWRCVSESAVSQRNRHRPCGHATTDGARFSTCHVTLLPRTARGNGIDTTGRLHTVNCALSDRCADGCTVFGRRQLISARAIGFARLVKGRLHIDRGRLRLRTGRQCQGGGGGQSGNLQFHRLLILLLAFEIFCPTYL